MPTPEAAEQWGFGLWADFVFNPGNEDLAEELLTPEARTAFGIPEGGRAASPTPANGTRRARSTRPNG
ncbi:hypothetical protein O1R50_07890 [Glycomyces luteolus]|uniref:Uncharacterized protein n=1 Tax=Glycomyces luteolus TaxID=2670330 RepID=A0A9X3P665_9ACTN|nr:hypothetical protein [Glycomyces luteolus]MDA1359538.1 hypothetical protein [Glycomyces luteolus]